MKQQVREVHVSVLVEGLRANLRAAWRFIRRSPSFAAAVVLTLALGIGANSAVFSAIDAILLRPLSFPHGDELVEVHQQNLKKKSPLTFVAPARLEDWNRYNTTFQAISGYYTQSISLRTGELPEKITDGLGCAALSAGLGNCACDGPRLYERGAEVWRTERGSGERSVLAESSGSGSEGCG